MGTNFDWQQWADQFPVQYTVYHAQDDNLIVKPEVIDITRKGHPMDTIQLTRAELVAALAELDAQGQQTVSYALTADETRTRTTGIYDDGIRAFNLYPPQEGNAHESAVMGVYEVGFIDGRRQAYAEQRAEKARKLCSEDWNCIKHDGHEGGHLS